MGQLVRGRLVARPAVNASRRTYSRGLAQERGTKGWAEIRRRTVRADVARLPWWLPFPPLGATVLQEGRRKDNLLTQALLGAFVERTAAAGVGKFMQGIRNSILFAMDVHSLLMDNKEVYPVNVVVTINCKCWFWVDAMLGFNSLCCSFVLTEFVIRLQ